MKSITDKELKEQVVIEATRLVKYAKKTELSNLDFDCLSPLMSSSCIYGQMTGNCYSDRANSLITKCSSKFINADHLNSEYNALADKKGYNMIDRTANVGYWSPIEFFIANPENYKNGNNKMLISFLKGNRKTLRFK